MNKYLYFYYILNQMTEEAETPQDKEIKTTEQQPPCEQIKGEMLSLAQKKNDLERGLRQINRTKKILPEHTELGRTAKKIKKEIDEIDNKIQETYTKYVMCGYDKNEPEEEKTE